MELFNHGNQSRRKTEFKPVKVCLKIDLVSHPVCVCTDYHFNRSLLWNDIYMCVCVCVKTQGLQRMIIFIKIFANVKHFGLNNRYQLNNINIDKLTNIWIFFISILKC